MYVVVGLTLYENGNPEHVKLFNTEKFEAWFVTIYEYAHMLYKSSSMMSF